VVARRRRTFRRGRAQRPLLRWTSDSIDISQTFDALTGGVQSQIGTANIVTAADLRQQTTLENDGAVMRRFLAQWDVSIFYNPETPGGGVVGYRLLQAIIVTEDDATVSNFGPTQLINERVLWWSSEAGFANEPSNLTPLAIPPILLSVNDFRRPPHEGSIDLRVAAKLKQDQVLLWGAWITIDESLAGSDTLFVQVSALTRTLITGRF